MSARGLDHLVVVSDDLQRLAADYRALGFTVGRRNRHPWGTENHVIQFDGSFFELLGFASDFVAPQVADGAYPFAGFMAEWVAKGRQGAAMMVLRAADAEADARAFEAAGIGQGRLLPFSRSAEGPDGSDRTVAFTIAFAMAPTLPEIGFFTCQQLRPENFWNREAQQHPNTATGFRTFVIVADRPEDSAGFFTAYTEAEPEQVANGHILFDGPQGGIAVVDRAAAARDFGLQPEWLGSEPRLAAAVVSVADLDRCRDSLDLGRIGYSFQGDRLVVSPTYAGNVTLLFEASSSRKAAA